MHIPYIHTSFLTSVCIKAHKEYKYSTCDDIEFMVNEEKFVIPKLFHTDLASIPRIIWPIMSPAHSSLIRASIVHDWLYHKPYRFDRKESDIIFYHMLINDGISKFKAKIMYWSVRIFGRNFYGSFYHGY